jgi:hypothetical protein
MRMNAVKILYFGLKFGLFVEFKKRAREQGPRVYFNVEEGIKLRVGS